MHLWARMIHITLILFLLTGSLSFAGEQHLPHAVSDTEHGTQHVHGSHVECPLPSVPMDTLRCATENHPDVKRAKLAAQHSESLTEVAAQIPNPELETQSMVGQLYGDTLMQTQISLTQPIEWGGRRSSRIQVAYAQQSQAQSDLRQAQAEIVKQTVKKLHRLRQIENERETLEEAVGSFSKLVAQYRERQRLTPEQEASRAVFEMAQADSKIKLSVLLEEEREIGHFFHVATGNGLSEIKKALPTSPKSWPKISERNDLKPPSPYMARLLSDQELFRADQSAAVAASWPGLRLGPMVQLESSGPIQGQIYGLQLNIEIPVFNLNGGGRLHAARGIERAEKSISLLKAEESHERVEQTLVYQGAVSALSEAPSLASLERQHQRIEELSVRGLISGAMVVEAHRQRSELQKSRNERELKAIEALWIIYNLDGRIFEESL